MLFDVDEYYKNLSSRIKVKFETLKIDGREILQNSQPNFDKKTISEKTKFHFISIK
jgi:hypothetical protein